jgi:hypothetical protein
MVRLLETAEVLEHRARRTRDPTQVPVLLRLVEHRRRQAAELRARLTARGAALATRVRARSADPQPLFSRASPHGQRGR